MTTPAREKLYQAQHLVEMEGRRNVIHNPHDRPVDELPVIYGFNNGGSPGWYRGVLLAEDGTALGGHVCSHECYMPSDLAVLEGERADRHDTFRAHYPDGYRMEFVGWGEVKIHEGLNAAIERHQAAHAAAAADDEGDQ